VRREKIIEEKTKMGISTKNDAALKKFQSSMSTSKKNSTEERIKLAPIRLLNEEVRLVLKFSEYWQNLQLIMRKMPSSLRFLFSFNGRPRSPAYIE
jgi:hypothetical protein